MNYISQPRIVRQRRTNRGATLLSGSMRLCLPHPTLPSRPPTDAYLRGEGDHVVQVLGPLGVSVSHHVEADGGGDVRQRVVDVGGLALHSLRRGQHGHVQLLVRAQLLRVEPGPRDLPLCRERRVKRRGQKSQPCGRAGECRQRHHREIALIPRVHIAGESPG